MTPETVTDTVRPLVTDLRVEPLTDPDLCGRAVADERHSIIATI